MSQWYGRATCLCCSVLGCSGVLRCEWSGSIVRCVSDEEVVSSGGYRTKMCLWV